MKITPTMRRMIRDTEFRDAVAMLIEAQDKLRDIEFRNRRNRNGEPISHGESVASLRKVPR